MIGDMIFDLNISGLFLIGTVFLVSAAGFFGLRKLMSIVPE